MAYKSIVLAGGRGERLRPFTVNKTKITRPIARIPMIFHVLNSLDRSGIDEAHMAIAYKLTDVITTVETRYDGNINFRFYHPHTNPDWEMGDPKPTFRGTADAVRQAPEEIKKYNPLVVASGDQVWNFPLDEAIDKHEYNAKKHGAYATIVGVKKTKEKIANKLGQFVFDKRTGLIKDFKEKPPIKEVKTDIANAGIYIFSGDVLKYLDENPHLVDFGKHVFKGDLLKDKRLYSHVFGDEYVWTDVGTLGDYLETNIAVAQGIDGIERGVRFDEKTKCILGQRCEIHGKVSNSVIGSDVKVDKKSSVINSVIGDNTHVYGTDVEDSIADKRVSILPSKGIRRVAIGEGTELDYGTTILRDGLEEEDFRVIFPNFNIMDGKTIREDMVYDPYF